MALRTSGAFKDRTKPEHVRDSNIVAAKAVANAVRTSLGPIISKSFFKFLIQS